LALAGLLHLAPTARKTLAAQQVSALLLLALMALAVSSAKMAASPLSHPQATAATAATNHQLPVTLSQLRRRVNHQHSPRVAAQVSAPA
jgi:hypothetical protein